MSQLRVSRTGIPLFAAAIVFSACSRDNPVAPPVAPPLASSPTTSAALTADDIIEDAPIVRYTIDLDASGTIKPGKAVSLQIRTTARLASPQTTIRVIVPEMQSLSALAGGLVPSVSTWTTRIDSGATESRTVKVTFPTPGTYTVMVDASYGGVTPVNLRVQNVAGNQITIDVQDKGSKIRREKTAVTTGAGVMMIQPCPFSVPQPTDPTIMIMPCEPPPDPPPAPSLTYVTGRVQYTGPGLGFLPLRRARVTYTTPSGVTGTSRTDENGNFTVGCAPSSGTTTVRFNLDNANDIIITEAMPYNIVGVAMGTGCAAPNLFISGWQEARVWDNMLRVVDGSRSYFQFSRPRLEVVVGTRFGSSSVYRGTSDFVQITPDAIFGSWGVFTASHEYGHALQARTPNGIPGVSCPSPHYLEYPSNGGCAFVEGFADYHSVAAVPDGNFETDNFESDAFRRSGCTNNYACESLVAATLLDLSDPVNPADPDGYSDDIALPGRQVLDMFGSCSLYFAMRLQYGGETVSSFWQSPLDILQIRDCLIQDYPKFRAPIGAYELWWMRVIVPWPALTGSVANAVILRFAR